MLKSARVPAPFVDLFTAAERHVERRFEKFERHPEDGTIRVDGERYVLVRAEGLYLAWFDALSNTFGEETANGFIYNTAREIGRADSRSFAERLGVSSPLEKLASGPVHFAHAGWAFVNVYPTGAPATDDSFFMHYAHPNTFETEVLRQRGIRRETCACLFSAGYSAGWSSEAFGVEVHARELFCLARGDDRCEFIMAPEHKLDEHARRVIAAANAR